MPMRSLLILLLLAAAGACRPATGAGSGEPTVADAAQVMASLYEALNAHDVETVLAHYLDTDELLYVGVTDAVQGWATFASMTRSWHRTNPNASFQYEIQHVQILGPDVMTVTCRGSSTDAPHLTWTRTLVQRNGAWLIALEHESWPGATPPRQAHP